ncbi:MAG: putative lipid II flippase FtsW [Chloroflexi bacterium]|nr:putative lipid II flippase FtsW [Chloroflexota bacterium]
MTAASRTGEWAPGRPDFALLALTAVLTITGLVAVWSASFVIGLATFGDANYFIVRQVAWAALGLVLMAVAIRTDYRIYRKYSVVIMAGTIATLAAVLLVGVEVNGARRWLGSGQLTVQPAEFAKLTVILYLAAWLASKENSAIRSVEHGLFPFIVIIGLVGGLIMLEPSLGTTMTILVITVTMFWVAGASFTQMLALGFAGALAIGLLASVSGYRADRLSGFFNGASDPAGGGFQTLQSVMAIGNGGIHGLGLGASRGKFFYIPESHTDGVFAIIGEELGLVATVAVLFLFMLLMFRGFQVARRARDEYGMLVATGIATWIASQALLNIGGITRIIPLTGVPLPFLSFGGTALASVMFAMGVLINISRYGRDRGGYNDEHSAARRRRVISRRRA